MNPPQVILDLVEHFQRNADDLRSNRYNETELRREFLDPFFEALGWDVNNRLRYSKPIKMSSTNRPGKPSKAFLIIASALEAPRNSISKQKNHPCA